MKNDRSYEAVMAKRGEIMKKAVGIDYEEFSQGKVAFDYEGMMRKTGYSLEEVQNIQHSVGVGNTPLLELKNLTALARKFAPEGKGARIFIKDEASNPSGSYKARRASTSVYHAKKNGFKGVIAATSGNYGAAVASQAAIHGLDTIVIQECYDSRGVGQPEIIEKARKCEAYGAEVVQLTVGPELFYTFLTTLEDTGYFNASLYTPFGIAGVETLGYEISMNFRERFGKDPDAVICTNAGGGNLTGTARGLIKAGAEHTRIIGASVDLSGLHMASDNDFNRKSFTTGHTGFGMPYATWPDRTDVPRSAARPLRYMDEYVLVSQGEVFYMTEALAQIEGLERGPAGNTSLAAAFSLAQEMGKDETIVVQESEYTGAGKHLQPQLSFAKDNGIHVFFGDPSKEIPGQNIILPENPSMIKARKVDLMKMKKSYIKNAVQKNEVQRLNEQEMNFLQDDAKLTREALTEFLDELKVEYGGA